MGLKLNLGSSKNWEKEGWTIVDQRIEKENNSAKRGDASSIPLKSGSCSIVFTSHMLEHIPHYELAHVFLEINRILEVGGLLRLVVPDLKRIARAYVNQDEKFFKKTLEEHEKTRIDLGYGGMFMNFAVAPGQDTALFNKDLTQFIGGYSHLYLYDFEMLKILLKNAGFKDIKQMDFCESAIDELKEPLHVIGLDPVWQNMNKKFYKKNKLTHIYRKGNYTIDFKVTGFDRDPVTSLIIEAKKGKNIRKDEYNDFNGKNCRNYNHYGFSLLWDNKFKKKVEISKEINRLIDTESNKEVLRKKIIKILNTKL